jgi:hypothetical protein
MGSNANSRDDDVSHTIKRQIADWFDYNRRRGYRETPQSIRRRARKSPCARAKASGG